MSAYQSAIKAGYSKATAWNAHKNIENRCNFEQLFAEAGFDDKAIVTLISAGMLAKKPIACNVMIRDDNGKLIVVKNENDWIEYEDWNARDKFIKNALELMKKIDHQPLIDQSLHSHFTYVWKDTNHQDRLFTPELSEGDSR